MGKFVDLTGQRFGRLSVIEKSGVAKSGHALWLCKCDCGNSHIVSSNQLKNGTKSCGCLQRERAAESARQRTHIHNRKKLVIGKDFQRLHQCYKDMLNRCYKENNKRYHRYGGRGIEVCDEWRNDFYAFKSWATANGYSNVLTLDRIDVYGNYEPSNCRWVSTKEQNNNRSNNKVVRYCGEEMTLHQLSEKYNIPYKTLWGRINGGWTVSSAVETPIRVVNREY